MYVMYITVYIQEANICNIARTSNKELNIVSKWIAVNKLPLSFRKTRFMISSSLLTFTKKKLLKYTTLN